MSRPVPGRLRGRRGPGKTLRGGLSRRRPRPRSSRPAARRCASGGCKPARAAPFGRVSRRRSRSALGDGALYGVAAGDGPCGEPRPARGCRLRGAGVVRGDRHRLCSAGRQVAQPAVGQAQHVAGGQVGGSARFLGGDREHGSGVVPDQTRCHERHRRVVRPRLRRRGAHAQGEDQDSPSRVTRVAARAASFSPYHGTMLKHLAPCFGRESRSEPRAPRRWGRTTSPSRRAAAWPRG